MTVTVVLNDLGRLMLRGRAAIVNDAIVLATPKNTVTAITLDLTRWLAGAALSSRAIAARGMTLTDQGVASNVWSLEASRTGDAELKATASDGRVFVTYVQAEETLN